MEENNRPVYKKEAEPADLAEVTPAEALPAAEEENDETAVAAEEKKAKRNKESVGKVVLRVVISIAIIVVCIIIVLLIVAKASHYDSVGSMLNHMFGELQLMWQRITS